LALLRVKVMRSSEIMGSGNPGTALVSPSSSRAAAASLSLIYNVNINLSYLLQYTIPDWMLDFLATKATITILVSPRSRWAPAKSIL
jgi:hypothetical protein